MLRKAVASTEWQNGSAESNKKDIRLGFKNHPSFLSYVSSTWYRTIWSFLFCIFSFRHFPYNVHYWAWKSTHNYCLDTILTSQNLRLPTIIIYLEFWTRTLCRDIDVKGQFINILWIIITFFVSYLYQNLVTRWKL